LVNYCFDDLTFHRIEAGFAIGNLRSIRVLEKIRFVREGRHRNILPIRGEWKDNFTYALLEDEYPNKT
jgi:RimJ/RimL family protein N-acetyltransferase